MRLQNHEVVPCNLKAKPFSRLSLDGLTFCTTPPFCYSWSQSFASVDFTLQTDKAVFVLLLNAKTWNSRMTALRTMPTVCFNCTSCSLVNPNKKASIRKDRGLFVIKPKEEITFLLLIERSLVHVESRLQQLE